MIRFLRAVFISFHTNSLVSKEECSPLPYALEHLFSLTHLDLNSKVALSPQLRSPALYELAVLPLKESPHSNTKAFHEVDA